jgi:hypothetical protein
MSWRMHFTVINDNGDVFLTGVVDTGDIMYHQCH